jgi:hypothetical protein
MGFSFEGIMTITTGCMLEQHSLLLLTGPKTRLELTAERQ